VKFTNGNWLMRQGVRAAYPAEAWDVEAGESSLTVLAPTKPIGHRDDTHDITVLTVELSAPMDDVIRVKIAHFTGERPPKPEFELQFGKASRAAVSMDASSATLASGRLSARVARNGEWGLEFSAEGARVTASGRHAMGYIEQDDGRCFVHEQLSLAVGENVYGLGERFTPFVKNGQAIDIWNADGGTASEQAYKNIPFYLTNRGYGVFVNHPGPVSFEVASEKTTRVQFSSPGQGLEYMVIYGPTPKEVLEKYTALTGRPALPPAWSFGLWLSTSFTTSYDEKTVTGMIRQMAERKVPLHVFHFDTFWMREFQWCDFTWNTRVFPDPAGMLSRLKALGLRICLWINPYIAQRSPLFEEGAREGYLLKKPNGDVWQTDLWQPGMGLVDFTNPSARLWYRGKLATLLDMGVDAFKTDFGERVPTDVAYHDASDPQRMHNYYTYLYNKTVFELLSERRGVGEAVVFARSATVGSQRFPVHWGGDNESSFESMAESLRGGLSLGLCGFGFWSHDIGGFEGVPPTALYKRWIAFGLLSSHSRLHGSTSYRVPWLFDEEAVDVLGHFTRLKCRLMPYLYARAIDAAHTGVPVMRAMLLEFPEDQTCSFLDRQYMLGDSLLVAPVFSADGTVEYYLPAGRWTSLSTGEVKSGPGWVIERHDFKSLPLMVREGSLIAFGAIEDRPDYEYADDVTIALYELGEGKSASVAIPTQSGKIAATVEARRDGTTISVVWRGSLGRWKLKLIGLPRVSCTECATVSDDPTGAVVTAKPDKHRIWIELGKR
jgi:alpha-D-xyloside xylohydrolase